MEGMERGTEEEGEDGKACQASMFVRLLLVLLFLLCLLHVVVLAINVLSKT